MSTGSDPTRDAVIDAARTILVADGAASLTVRRVASGAGHSTMAVYSRFGGKDGIVDVLFAEGFQALTDAMDTVGSTDDPLDDLRRASTAYRDFALGAPRHYSLMFERPVPGFMPSARASEVAIGALQALAHLVERTMSAGLLTEGDPFETAVSLWSTCHGLVSLELAGTAPPMVDWGATYRRTCEALLAGLAAR